MSYTLRYIHIPESHYEPDDVTVRRCLYHFGKQLQHHGEIPKSVTEHELVQTLEQYVPQIVRAIQHTPQYPELLTTDQREQFITGLLRELL